MKRFLMQAFDLAARSLATAMALLLVVLVASTGWGLLLAVGGFPVMMLDALEMIWCRR